MASKQHGRRAANAKAKTPLTTLSELLASNSGAFGRRAAVVAASGGLLTAAVLPAAGQGAGDEAKVAAESEKQAPVEFENQTPVIDAGGSSKKGDQKSEVTVDTDVVTAEAAPKPKPKPKPEPKEEPETTVAEPAPAEEPEEEPSESSDNDSDSPDAGSKDESPKKDTGGSDDSGPIDGSKAEQVLGWAEKGVGTPYVFGGTSQSGWDCSGYTSWVYSHVGVDLPRQSGAQKESGTVVSESEAKPGDLIWRPGHVGIYAGDGQMYDAGSPGSGTSKRSYSWMGDVTFIRVL
ncbi:NlpC/P60 family protein [Brevibacterium siliguriense]|uniref:NlpC/P60 family protein n=1 Tax=Brevibacterium siliguriense TaxID=1136497 RepID=A0A1H1R5L6_9MICO|nr:C40 family peptidase [Brevibacterium siliguriense]SDS31094.1 NlpC/P60 family protein [Brevibacterium siliguriense]